MKKKSSEEVLRVLSAMKGRAESHSELINSLLSMSEHGFSLGSFAHVLDELFFAVRTNHPLPQFAGNIF